MGSHCGDDATCTWSCLESSECGDGRHCDVDGACVAGAVPWSANNTPACQAIPAAERRAAVIEMHENAQQHEFIRCDNDETCPCGTYCSLDAVCTAACVTPNPIPELTCGSGLACTPLGRCATSPTDPGPPLELTLALSEPVVTANTVGAPVIKPLAVRVAAISLAALDPTSPAPVRLTIAEVRAFEQGRTDEAPVNPPRLRCAAGAPLTSSCTIDGGWTFDVVAGTLQSAPKSIWVEIPQSATEQDWTLEARSEWAADPAQTIVRAVPVTFPATDPGRYRGTMALPNAGAVPATDAITMPIEALVTSTHVAIFDPTRLVLPDGHVVISRSAANATLVGWLTSTPNAGSPRFDVVLRDPQLTYVPATGHLAIGMGLVTRTGVAATPITLALERTGDVDAPACPCATDSYCNTAMARCLPGSGPPSGGGIVSASTAVPSVALPSTTLDAWVPPLTAMVALDSTRLAGTSGVEKIERPYCFESSTQPPQTPARFATTGSQDPASADLLCKHSEALPEYPQPTFAFLNRETEYRSPSSGAAFDLYQTCLDDLAVTPTGPANAANLLAAKKCVSLGRFFTALSANASGGIGQPLPENGQRLVTQLLRQWLGVNAYVASSAVQVRRFDDALALSSAAVHDRLGSVVDLVEDGLRVLLDLRVRPQFASGPDLAAVTVRPDYRIASRPTAWWSFNGGPSPAPDGEGLTPFTATGVSLAGELYASGVPGTQFCTTTTPVALSDRRFTIAANLRLVPRATTVVVDKVGPGGDRLWVEAAPTQTGFMLLTVKDSRGGVVTFPAVESGFIAIVADNGAYRLLRGTNLGVVTQLSPTSVIAGGPRWGAAGTVRLACDLPVVHNSCTSWHRNYVGDYLDITLRPTYVEQTPQYHYECSTKKFSPYDTSCSGPVPSSTVCTNGAATKRTQIINGLHPNPLQASVSALSVTGAIVYTGGGETELPRFTIEWTDWRCKYTVQNHPMPVTGVKPACPTPPPDIRWDEVSLWSRPITNAELGVMAATYKDIKTNQSLPAKPLTLAGEQSAALPVHIIESASAQLDLISDYIAAERAVMYEECYRGGPSPSRDRAVARAGRNLRLISLLESEAAYLAGLPGAATATWYARYQGAHRTLAGRRARAMRELQLAHECHNPLGITEDDLPLYVGEEVGPTGKFFASSRFLTTKAKEEINHAQNRFDSAKAKYLQQRESAFQLSQHRENKAMREGKLRADYESALIRYCGKPVGTALLDGFLAGTLTPSNCFIKTELPQCADGATRPLKDLPAACLRGDVGARLLAIQAAAIDMSNAMNTHTRAVEQFDGDMAYCARLQAEREHNQDLLTLHNRHMKAMRDQKRELGLFGNFVTSLAHLAAGQVGSAFGTLVQEMQLDIAIREEAAQARYQEVVAERRDEEDLAACFHNVDNQKFAIDAAKDVMTRAGQDVTNAQFQLDNDRNAIEGLLDAAAGQLALEATLDSSPPHHHFWLDTEISDYHRHVTYARRLTYLALRALEYESQQPEQLSGYRTQALTARRPADLDAVATAIEQRSAPMQGVPGFVVGAPKIVLSLRDEILRMGNLGGNPLPGEPQLSPEQAFKRYMMSESSKILDATGRYIGRGIRFSVRPSAWSETSCAERIWRLMPSLQIDNPPNQHGMVLYQENAFGSQDCSAPFDTVTVSRAQSSMNLLTGDAAAFGTPSSMTALNIDGPLGLSHETLRDEPESNISGLAGRGLYANYVLLFPPMTWTDANIAKIKDVLLRFDIVEVTHAPPL
jgi:hypothetical protein